MNSMQENIEQRMSNMFTLFVRCVIDSRPRQETDPRTPPIVTIEVFAKPSDNHATVIHLDYEASHRDSLLRRMDTRKLLIVEEFKSLSEASDAAYNRWEKDDGLYRHLWVDESAAACEIKSLGGSYAPVPMTNWLLITHLMRLRDFVDVELAKMSFSQLMEGGLGSGQVTLMQPLSHRLAGLIAYLVSKRLELD